MQLFLMFFGLPMLGFRIEPWTAAALALTFFASAYLGEIWRGGVDALPRGQWDAGASLGLHYFQELRLIILPQAFAITRAPIVGFLVQLIKSTALTSIIGFEELMRTSNAINNATFEPFTVYGLVALIFFVLCFPLTQYARMLEATSGGPLTLRWRQCVKGTCRDSTASTEEKPDEQTDRKIPDAGAACWARALPQPACSPCRRSCARRTSR